MSIFFLHKVMPRKKKSIDNNEECLSWTYQMDEALVDAFLHQQNSGNRVNGTFTPKAYDNIMKELKERLGMQIEKDKIKNRWKTMKSNFAKCFDVIQYGMSGFGWNPVTKMWSAEPEVWQRLIEVCFDILQPLKLVGSAKNYLYNKIIYCI